MTNIRDVSQLAGVSVATVSRAFSDPDKVATKTLEKVRLAAEQLKYTPNSLAQIFRSKQTNTAVVIVPDLSNAFFARVLSGIEEAATEAGLSLLLANSHDDIKIEQKCLNMVRSYRADGIIQLGARTLEQLVDGEATLGIPFVHAIEAPNSVISSSVRIDNTTASMCIVKLLIDAGHKHIGVIAGQSDSEITQRRLDGYRAALNANALAAPSDCIEHDTYSLKGGEAAAARLLDRKSDLTALFCMSDELAIGAIKELKNRGYKVPQDISVTGFDNIELGAYIEDGLTTMTQPSHQMGKKAMQMLIDELANPDMAHKEHYVLSAELVERGSVAPPRQT